MGERRDDRVDDDRHAGPLFGSDRLGAVGIGRDSTIMRGWLPGGLTYDDAVERGAHESDDGDEPDVGGAAPAADFDRRANAQRRKPGYSYASASSRRRDRRREPDFLAKKRAESIARLKEARAALAPVADPEAEALWRSLCEIGGAAATAAGGGTDTVEAKLAVLHGFVDDWTKQTGRDGWSVTTIRRSFSSKRTDSGRITTVTRRRPESCPSSCSAHLTLRIRRRSRGELGRGH